MIERAPDREDLSGKKSLYMERSLSLEKPFEIKNLIGFEYSQFIAGMFKIKVPSG